MVGDKMWWTLQKGHYHSHRYEKANMLIPVLEVQSVIKWRAVCMFATSIAIGVAISLGPPTNDSLMEGSKTNKQLY